MKVFEFHPETGRIGDLIDERPLAGWGDCSLEFLASNGEQVPEYVTPHRRDAEFTSHIDAGRETYSKVDGITFVSYKHDTKWVAFCTGHVQCGDQDYWDWWILPSREAYTPSAEEANDYQTWQPGERAA